MAHSHVNPNTVVYKIHSVASDDLAKLRGDILESISDVAAPYIWQKEPFSLHVVNGCLFGEVDFGDNIEDEWFIVYLLFEISRSFPTLAIEVLDDDGEFLLIEAADHLPKWMSPEVCSNRVFIFRGNMHVISPKMLSEVKSGVEGGRYIAQHPDQTVVSPAIFGCIKKRISGYPILVRSSQHSVNCFIPANLAAVLSERPQLVALGVNAFSESISTSTKRPKIMTFFRPINRVLHRVTMSKCLYAQLMFPRFVPDRKEGWASADLVRSMGAKALDLGTKLAYGFEYACKRAQSISEPNGSVLPDESVFTTPAFNRYITSLHNNGYFRDNLEGSKDYTRLFNQAKTYYVDSLYANGNVGVNYVVQSGRLLLELLQRVKVDIEKMKKENANLPPDDDDSWLYDFECSLNAIGERAGFPTSNGNGKSHGNGKSNGNGHANGSVPLDELMSKMNKFVSAMSSAVDGVDIPDAGNGDGECRHVDSSESGSESEEEDAAKRGSKKDGPCLDDFMMDSDEYGDGHGDSSLDEDYASDKQIKQLMVQMDKELKQVKYKAIGKDDVRTKSASKVLASNMTMSQQAEGARPGPASILLKQLRIKMPSSRYHDSDDDSD